MEAVTSGNCRRLTPTWRAWPVTSKAGSSASIVGWVPCTLMWCSCCLPTEHGRARPA